MKKRIIEYDIVRTLLVILVVIGHSTYYAIVTKYGGINYFPLYNTYKSWIIIDKIRSFIYMFHMPLFFILSGALFANSKKINLKQLINKKFKKLIIPFLVVSLLFSIPIKYISLYYLNSCNIFKDIIIGQILLQGNTHLWFLPTLFFIFIFIYILDKIPNTILKIFLLFILNIFNKYISINLLQYICNFSLYFYIGYLFHLNKEKIDIFFNKTINIIPLLFILIFISYITLINLLPKEIFNILFVLLISSIIYMITLLIKKIIKRKKFIEFINKYSFGIYLYSDSLNYLILFIVFKLFNINFFYSNSGIITLFFIRIILTSIISILITYLLKKTNIKYIS